MTPAELALRSRLRDVEGALCITPIVQLADEHLDLRVKLEFQNVVGSIKDRPAFWVLRQAIGRGEIAPDSTIVESSSGNFAIALATFCRLLGLTFIPVIDPNVTPAYEALLRTMCTTVVKVEDRDDTGGYLKTRLAAVQATLARRPHGFWPNQYGNADGMAAHHLLTGGQIATQLDDLDYIYVGVSTAGTIAGVSRRIRERFPRCTVVAVDTAGSVIFGGPPQPRYVPGIGSSIVPPLVAAATIDEIVHVPEIDAVAGCHELWTRHGIFAGGSTGSAYAAIMANRPRRRGLVRPRVLFLAADRGGAYLDTIYNPRWVEWLAATTRAPLASAGGLR